jgi:hypothetical protein
MRKCLDSLITLVALTVFAVGLFELAKLVGLPDQRYVRITNNEIAIRLLKPVVRDGWKIG